MILDENLPTELKNLNGAHIFDHGFLPIAASFCRKLGLIELVNNCVESHMLLQPGHVVQAMVLDTLSGRSPLYHLEDFLAQQDIELLLGTKIDSSLFNDTNIARSLDTIFEAGASKIITELGTKAVKEFSLNTKTISYDTTSTSVWGAYQDCEKVPPPNGPIITYGHSKDNQPNLKQFMTELLCVEQGVPIFGKTLDGNSSDKTSNNTILSNISILMAKHGLGAGAFVYVADSAMVTEKNLNTVGSNAFITRLPATYLECQRAVESAVTANQWNELGVLAQEPTASNRQSAFYKVFETTVTLYEIQYRALVVHSSSHDKRRKKKLDKSIAASANALNAQLNKFNALFFCEEDAKRASKKIEALTEKYHTAKVQINTEDVRAKGRPPKNKPARTKTKYKLSWNLVENESAIEREKLVTGCFVLLSNVEPYGKNTLNSRQLLQTYKGQYGVESDFGFLKDPLIVNDLFLKKPHRIEALGMILIIALMIWRLIERSMRVYVENENVELKGWDKKNTTKPTTYMLTRVLYGIMVAVINGKRILLHSPNKRQLEFIETLGLGISVFTDPLCLCNPQIPKDFTEKG